MRIPNIIHIELKKIMSVKYLPLIIFFIVINTMLTYGIFKLFSVSAEESNALEKAIHFNKIFDIFSDMVFTCMLFSFILIYNTGREFQLNTLRKNMIDGYSRHEFFKGKIYLIGILSIVFSLLHIAIFIISGCLFFDFNLRLLLNAISVQYMLKLTAGFFYFACFGLMLSIALRSIATALLSFIGYYFMELFITYFNRKEWNINAIDYLPLEAMKDVISISELSYFNIFLVLSYLILFLGTAFCFLYKRDI